MRTIVITGASDGIGAAAAEILSAGDDRIILVGRSPEKTRAVAARTGAEYLTADFERLDDVRRLTRELRDRCERIDVLANNAGGTFAGPVLTADGFERTFQVNHLAPTLLTHGLIDLLLDSQGAVVHTSSVGARLFGRVDFDDFDSRSRFRSTRAYGTAKLANIIFSHGLHRRFHARGLSSAAFHPGVVATGFAADTGSLLRWAYHGPFARFLSTPAQGGAVLALFAGSVAGTSWRSGHFYDERGRAARTNPQASDIGLIDRHWHRTAEMLGLVWP